ncbi:MAG: hypothetical protein ACOCRX_10810 [Candidatus Woesearchaeota archaeon]
MKRLLLLLVIVISVFTFAGCNSSADRVAHNLGKQAEEFRILRRIAAVNGITDKPIFEAVGYCSIETSESGVSGMMELTCRVGKDNYTKDFIYLSDNVLIVVEQLEGLDVPQYHKQIIFAPQALLPIPEIVGGEIGE